MTSYSDVSIRSDPIDTWGEWSFMIFRYNYLDESAVGGEYKKLYAKNQMFSSCFLLDRLERAGFHSLNFYYTNSSDETKLFSQVMWELWRCVYTWTTNTGSTDETFTGCCYSNLQCYSTSHPRAPLYSRGVFLEDHTLRRN